MKLHELTHAEGARTPKKRVGRGPGSGLGKTCGKGHKGQRARSGSGIHPWFEGGADAITASLTETRIYQYF